MATWIDFKALRSSIRIGDVLASYGVELKIKGDRATGFCPLPGHDGNRRSPSFSVHLGRGIFQCFSCGGKGNVIDLVALLEGLNPSDPAHVRKAALILSERFGSAVDNRPPVPSRRAVELPKPRSYTKRAHEPVESPPRKVVVNAPLDFGLKGLDASHPYLVARGFNLGTIGCFGLGYCSRGMMAGRIAIPLHDSEGKLIGYAGRIVDDTKIDENTPKYRFPSPRERDGITYEFKKSLFLYRGFCLPQHVSNLIVVEGFPSTWWLWQTGYANVVALMGASCSPEQATLIVKHVAINGIVWVCPDGDDAGDRMSASVFHQVGAYRAVRLVKLTVGKQPTDLSDGELAHLLGPPTVGERSQSCAT